MSRFLKKIGLLFIISMVIYPLLLCFWCSAVPMAFHGNVNFGIGSYGNMKTRLVNVESYQDIDILFLGSSLSYRGFDPRIFKQYGLTSFNLGSSSQTHIQTEVLLENYIDQLNPKLIIYECSPKSFTKDGVESCCDLLTNGHIGLNTARMTIKTKNMRALNKLIYGVYRQTFDLNPEFKPFTTNGIDTYIDGGFVEKKMKTGKYGNSPKEKKVWGPLGYQKKSFEKNVKLIQDKGIPLMIIRNPSTKRKHLSYKNNNEINEFLKSASDLFIDFNISSTSLDDSLHFYDSSHLNQLGVELFNHQLVDSLKTTGLFPTLNNQDD